MWEASCQAVHAIEEAFNRQQEQQEHSNAQQQEHSYAQAAHAAVISELQMPFPRHT
jgi:hypothetical protein